MQTNKLDQRVRGSLGVCRLKTYSLCLFLLLLSGCTRLDSREYGLRFWKFPPALGGGVSSKILVPGETVLDIPFLSEIYLFDAGVREISWGETKAEFVPLNTRALDGNEVSLSVTVSYRIIPEARGLLSLLQFVGSNDQQIRSLVKTTTEADVRTYMNDLRTSAFIQDRSRYQAVDTVQASLRERLEPFGIEILRLNLDNFRFDLEYEDKLKAIQSQIEETEREKARIATVLAQKEQERNNMQAEVNQMIEAAKGYRDQAMRRGDNLLKAKRNQADGILASGEAAATGLREMVAALSGPGGKALLKIELARQLVENNPSYIIVGEGSSDANSLAVNRLDTNDLIGQLGLLEGLPKKSESVPAKVPNVFHLEKKEVEK